MEFDLEPYKRQIDNLVDAAVSSVVESIVSGLGLDGDAQVNVEIEAAEQIEKYLSDKWLHERHQRWLKHRLEAVAERLEKVLEHPENDRIAFYTVEEAHKAAEILHERGYETKSLSDDASNEVVKFWKHGEEEPKDDWL